MGGAREEMKKEGKWGIISVGSLTLGYFHSVNEKSPDTMIRAFNCNLQG